MPTDGEAFNRDEECRHVHRQLGEIDVRVREVQKGQTGLHADHQRLTERVDGLERELLSDRDALTSHADHAKLMHHQIGRWIEEMRTDLRDWIARFERHDSQEQTDRRELIRSQRSLIWSILIAALTMIGGAFALLWHTGVLKP